MNFFGSLYRKNIFLYFFVVYLIGIIFSIRGLLLNQGESSALIKDDYFWLVVVDVGAYFIQLFAIHLISASILSTYLNIFNLKKEKTIFFFLAIYAVLYAISNNPQIFDDINQMHKLVLFVNEVMPWWTTTFLAVALVVYLIFVTILNWNNSLVKNLLKIALIGFACFYFFISQKFTSTLASSNNDQNSISTISKFNQHQKNNKILIGIDSLRGDVRLEDNRFVGNDLLKYLNSSTNFDLAISPIGRTHAAFMSFFTGKYPYENDFRDNLMELSKNTDQAIRGGSLELLKQQGYKIILMMDINRFVYFEKGNTIDQVIVPNGGYLNYIQPSFARNILMFSFYNNSLGYFFFPILKSNQAFSFAYKMRYFTGEVTKVLSDLQKQSSPFVFIVHTCALHSPASFYFPFFKKDSQNSGGVSHLSYGDFSFGTKNFFDHRKMLSPIDAIGVYQNGVNLIVSDFLNPLFRFIYKENMGENSEIILFSDHGEHFGDENNIATAQYPGHGNNLLLGDDSYHSYLRASIPGLSVKRVAEPFSLKNILTIDKSIKDSDNTEPVYSENGVINFNVPRGLIHNLPHLGFLKYKISPQNELVFFDKTGDRLGLLGKQRAVFFKNYKLILFASEYGLKYFIQSGNYNNVSVSEKVFLKLFADMRVSLAKDQEAKLFPLFHNPAPLSSHGSLDLSTQHHYEKAVSLQSSDQYLIYFRALELGNRYMQNYISKKLLFRLLSLKGLDYELKYKAYTYLLENCKEKDPFTEAELEILFSGISSLQNIHSNPLYSTFAFCRRRSDPVMYEKFQIEISDPELRSDLLLNDLLNDFKRNRQKIKSEAEKIHKSKYLYYKILQAFYENEQDDEIKVKIENEIRKNSHFQRNSLSFETLKLIRSSPQKFADEYPSFVQTLNEKLVYYSNNQMLAEKKYLLSLKLQIIQRIEHMNSKCTEEAPYKVEYLDAVDMNYIALRTKSKKLFEIIKNLNKMKTAVSTAELLKIQTEFVDDYNEYCKS